MQSLLYVSFLSRDIHDLIGAQQLFAVEDDKTVGLTFLQEGLPNPTETDRLSFSDESLR